MSHYFSKPKKFKTVKVVCLKSDEEEVEKTFNALYCRINDYKREYFSRMVWSRFKSLLYHPGSPNIGDLHKDRLINPTFSSAVYIGSIILLNKVIILNFQSNNEDKGKLESDLFVMHYRWFWIAAQREPVSKNIKVRRLPHL